jgi:hypothetical protein
MVLGFRAVQAPQASRKQLPATSGSWSSPARSNRHGNIIPLSLAQQLHSSSRWQQHQLSSRRLPSTVQLQVQVQVRQAHVQVRQAAGTQSPTGAAAGSSKHLMPQHMPTTVPIRARTALFSGLPIVYQGVVSAQRTKQQQQLVALLPCQHISSVLQDIPSVPCTENFRTLCTICQLAQEHLPPLAVQHLHAHSYPAAHCLSTCRMLIKPGFLQHRSCLGTGYQAVSTPQRQRLHQRPLSRPG